MIWEKQITYFLFAVLLFGTLQGLIYFLNDSGIIIVQIHPFINKLRSANYPIPFILIAIDILLVTPLIEEISFRGVLSSSILSVRISLAFLCAFLTNSILMFIGDYYHIILPYVIIMLLSVMFFFIIGNHTALFVSKKFISRKTRYVIITALIFAFFHLGSNYKDNNLFAILIYISPYFSMGVIYGLMRTRYGIIQSIYLHIGFNLFVFILNII